MFSRREQLIQKTGPDGVGRSDYLKQLAEEFQSSKHREGKRQVLANLANFAYDPINYEYIRKLEIIDLFLDELTNPDDVFAHFASAGIDNLVHDPKNQEYIISRNGISSLLSQISHKNEEIVINVLGTLVSLLNSDHSQFLLAQNVTAAVKSHEHSRNPRVRNLAQIFLTDINLHTHYNNETAPSKSS